MAPRFRKREKALTQRLIDEGKLGAALGMCIAEYCPYCNRLVYFIYFKDHSCKWKRLEQGLIQRFPGLTQKQAENFVVDLVYLKKENKEYPDDTSK